MSLFGALSSGVSGLSAQSSAMGAIADNVTNVNTIGFKGTDVQFQTLVTKQVSLTKFSPGGVQSVPRAGVDVQGLLQASTSATDIAISGQGFFVVNEQAEAGTGSLFAYTRSGSFKVDKDGFLQNTSGWYLQGWPLLTAGNNTSGFSTVTVGAETFIKAYKDADGDTVSINDNIVSKDDMRPINLNTIGGTAQETKNIRLGANLPAGDDAGDQHKSNVVMFDTLGNSHNFELVFTKDRENAWGLSLATPSGAATTELHGSDDTDSTPDVFAASGLLEFTGVPSDGETIIIDGITFEFDTDGSVTETATLRQVDISASTVTEASDVVPILKTAIDNSNLKETDRFVSSGANLAITQSTMGEAISVDVSNILAVKQVAANSNNGTFTVSQVDYAYKNGARIDFNSNTVPGDYDQLDTVIKTGTGTSTTFRAYVPAEASGANTFTITGGDTITAAAGTPFANYQVGDSITITGPTNTANAVTATIGSINGGGSGITLTTTPLTNGADTDMKVEIDDTASVDYVDIGSETTVAGVVSAIASAIDSNSNITNSSRFTADGTSLVFEQSSIGDAVQFTVDATTSAGGAGTVDAVYKDSTNITEATASDGVAFTVATSDYGAKKAAVAFNGDGTPSEFNVDNIDIQWANGAEDQEFTSGTDDTRIGLFLGNTNVADGMTQFAGSYQINFISQNGAQFGNFAGVSIGESGIVTALFDNGVTRPVFMIPVATFVNPNALESRSGNVYIETDSSGLPTVREAGEGGAGQISGAALESSTVDLGEEFTSMIVTQRAYSAAAKIITTTDEMLDELLAIKR